MTSASSPSDAAYTAAARPAGPAPTITTSRIASRSTDDVESEAVGDFFIRWIAEYDRAAAQDDRNVRRRNPERVEQGLDVLLRIEIDVHERMSVPRQELSQAQRSGAVCRAKKHGIAVAASDELGATQDERAHHDLADLALELEHAKHLVAIEHDDFSVFVRADTHERRPSGEQVGFSGELSGANDLNDGFAVVRHAQDLHRAAHDHKAGWMLIARLHQRLTAPHRAACPVGCEPLHLLRSERRKQSLGVSIRCLAHGSVKKPRANAQLASNRFARFSISRANVNPPAKSRTVPGRVAARARARGVEGVRLSADVERASLAKYLRHMSPRRATENSLRRERMLASPRFNGRVFQNTYPVSSGLKPGVERPTMREFLCPDENRIPSSPLPLVNPLPFWGTRPASGLRVTWLGHSALLIEIDGVRILTDPVWSNRASPLPFAGPKRFHPPPAPLDALPPLDGVILSHDHYDHLDRPTVLSLAKLQPKTRIITSLGVGERLERWGIPPKRITELDWWDDDRSERRRDYGRTGAAFLRARDQGPQRDAVVVVPSARTGTLVLLRRRHGAHAGIRGHRAATRPVRHGRARNWRVSPVMGRHPSRTGQRTERVSATRQRGVSAHSLGDVQPGDTSVERTGGNAPPNWHGGRSSLDHAEARRTCGAGPVERGGGRSMVACRFEYCSGTACRAGRAGEYYGSRADDGLT